MTLTIHSVCPYCDTGVVCVGVDGGTLVEHGDHQIFYSGYRLFLVGWAEWSHSLHRDMPKLTTKELLAHEASVPPTRSYVTFT